MGGTPGLAVCPRRLLRAGRGFAARWCRCSGAGEAVPAPAVSPGTAAPLQGTSAQVLGAVQCNNEITITASRTSCLPCIIFSIGLSSRLPSAAAKMMSVLSIPTYNPSVTESLFGPQSLPQAAGAGAAPCSRGTNSRGHRTHGTAPAPPARLRGQDERRCPWRDARDAAGPRSCSGLPIPNLLPWCPSRR